MTYPNQYLKIVFENGSSESFQASVEKKEVDIEETKSTIIEYFENDAQLQKYFSDRNNLKFKEVSYYDIPYI